MMYLTVSWWRLDYTNALKATHTTKYLQQSGNDCFSAESTLHLLDNENQSLSGESNMLLRSQTFKVTKKR